jgi:Flp pilus assembly protein TadG
MKGRTRLAGERGQLLILMAVIMLSVLSITAFSINVSFAYDKRNKLYAAADAAAKIAAVEVFRDGGIGGAALCNPCDETHPLQKFAEQQVSAHGFTPIACGATTAGAALCIYHPPRDPSPFGCTALPIGCDKYVEAVISEVTPTFFGGLLGLTSLTPTARSVAGVNPSLDCIVVFTDMSIANPSTGSILSMPKCTVSVGGNFSNKADTTLSSGIGANTCTTGGGYTCVYQKAAGGTTYPVTLGIPVPLDPLIKVPPYADPDPAGTAVDVTISPPGTSINPGKYHNIHFVAGVSTLTLHPGNYYITGLFDAQSGGSSKISIIGDGVMIYLAPTASVDFESNDVDLGLPGFPLNAATSGPYSGILFYQDRTTLTYTAVFGKNNTNFNMAGAFYFPTVTLKMVNENNNSGTNTCTLIVAYAIDWGKPVFSLDNSCPVFNGSPLLTVRTAE